MKYELVARNRSRFPIRRMCELLSVSASGFYAHQKRPMSQRARDNQELVEHIRRVHQESRQTYGSPRVHAQLRAEGQRCSLNRIARLMKKHHIQARRRKKRRKTTNSQHGYPVAPNLLQRQFQAERPNTKWLSDITYIPTANGWLYLAVVLDLFSRRIVGWAMERHMHASLPVRALKMALTTRQPQPGLLHHSDRGSQYAGSAYQRLVAAYHIQSSMSGIGNCFDNAPVESFFGTLKRELVHFRSYQTRREARLDIFEYIEGFYNTRRRHSALGYLSPLDFEGSRIPLFSVSTKSG